MRLDACVNCRGTCEEAFRFSERHFGGRITGIGYHREQPDPDIPRPVRAASLRTFMEPSTPETSPQMYVPHSFAEHDRSVLFDFIDAHPLAILVTATPAEGILATHLPLVLERERGPWGTLAGHLARANPQAGQLAAAGEALVVFTGPEAYVTPSWYPAKKEHGRVVPTWNYVAVHAYGTLHPSDEPGFLRRHLEALTARHESGRPAPWRVDDAPAEYVEQQLRAIVGFELRITRLEGKWKMSQNRPAADIDGVVRGLSASDDPADREVAALVAARKPRT